MIHRFSWNHLQCKYEEHDDKVIDAWISDYRTIDDLIKCYVNCTLTEIKEYLLNAAIADCNSRGEV